MLPISMSEFLLTMTISLFVMGVISILSGIFVLVTRSFGSEMKMISSQISRLGQKGIADDLADLVDNASNLLQSLTDLVKTASGIGLFLVLIGFILFAGVFYLITQFP